MGESQYVSIQDAALMTDKSAQTIRRLLKSNKVRYRKYKTPQGFTYLVEKSSLIDHYEHENDVDDLVNDEMELVNDEMELVEEFDPLPQKKVSFQDPAARIQTDAIHYQQARAHAVGARAHVSGVAPAGAMGAAGAGGAMGAAGAMGVSVNGAGDSQTIISQLLQQHRDDKKRLFELLEMFQKRILILEDQLKQLEGPKKKRWWRFGK